MASNDEIIEKLKSKVDTKPTPIELGRMEVLFVAGTYVQVARIYANRINQLGQSRHISVSEDEVCNYFNFLLEQRINQVTGGKTEFRTRYLKMPTLFGLTLMQIGECYDKSQGLKVKPVFDYENTQLFNIDEAEEFSQKLSGIEDDGMQLVQGLPRNTEGNIQYMLFQYVSGEDRGSMVAHITRHDDSVHPVQALLSSFFALQQLNTVLSARVSYGLLEDYHAMLRSLIYD